eukprot:1070668-Prorocentrum_minimum.AAC.5
MPLDSSSGRTTVVPSIDVTKAKCFKEEDKKAILEKVALHHNSCEAFNNKLKLHLLLKPLSYKVDTEQHLSRFRRTVLNFHRGASMDYRCTSARIPHRATQPRQVLLSVHLVAQQLKEQMQLKLVVKRDLLENRRLVLLLEALRLGDADAGNQRHAVRRGVERHVQPVLPVMQNGVVPLVYAPSTRSELFGIRRCTLSKSAVGRGRNS